MNGYTIKPSIEPEDKYEKARKDLIEARKSFEDLTNDQRKQLVKEVLGAELAMAFFNIFPQMF